MQMVDYTAESQTLKFAIKGIDAEIAELKQKREVLVGRQAACLKRAKEMEPYMTSHVEEDVEEDLLSSSEDEKDGPTKKKTFKKPFVYGELVYWADDRDTIYKVPISASEYYLVENRNRDPLKNGQRLTVLRNGVTTLVCTMKFASKEARDGAVATGMTDGMEMSYKQLDGVLATIKNEKG